MSTPAKRALPRGIRSGALLLVAGYAALMASLLLKTALAIAILMPLGIIFVAAGMLAWTLAAVREARSKGMI